MALAHRIFVVSAINYKAGQTRSNSAVIPLSALMAHLILDVNGCFK